MAIIDELKKQHKESGYRFDKKCVDHVIDFLTSRVKFALYDKKDYFNCSGIIYSSGSSNYVIGRPMDSEWFYQWIIEDENSAKFIVESLRKRIEEEFIPQRLDVRYNYNKRGIFTKKEYYTIYVDVHIKL